uniref:Uncharacterized protein n=1 Tax=Globodera rostochiensis TaxID=31243 RepID=A0A914GWI2_GLORO
MAETELVPDGVGPKTELAASRLERAAFYKHARAPRCQALIGCWTLANPNMKERYTTGLISTCSTSSARKPQHERAMIHYRTNLNMFNEFSSQTPT